MTGSDKDNAPKRPQPAGSRPGQGTGAGFAQDDPLAPFFSAARAAAPRASDALMARIAQDGARVQPRPVIAPVAVRPRTAQRLRAALARNIGGWGGARALAGAGAIAAVAVAGLWLGFTAPGPLAALESAVWGEDALAVFDAELAFLLAELDSVADTLDPTMGGTP